MTTARELPKYIDLPRSVYEDRREVARQRTEAVRRFFYSSTDCRDKILLDYFGEKDPDECGFCDICVDKRRATKGNNKAASEEYIEKAIIRLAAHPGGVNLGDLPTLLGSDTTLTLETARRLISAGRLTRSGQRLTLPT